MSINNLIYFKVLAETGNYAKAAEKLFIAQSTLSYAINTMEKELNVSLVTFTNRKTTLTESGSILYKYAAEILSKYEAAISEIQHHYSINRYKINIATTSISTAMKLINGFEAENSEQHIQIELNHINDETSLFKELGKESSAIGIGSLPGNPESFETIKVEGPEIVLIIPENHKLAGNDKVYLKEVLQNYPILLPRKPVFLNYRNYLHELGLDMKISGYGTDTYSVARMVANNFGIAIVSDIEVIRNLPVKILHIEGNENSSPRYVNRLKNKILDPSEKLFWDFVLENRACSR